ncbi:MAG: hypothetical protein A2603_11565 [Bdellovibrionales bacterium RIFOXYD1_FULL_55_31]|nr:MAG: hypothetical protein A2603_11565 [Bdellovibrionales bacterium RIFOXYD1_FULL_55_31]
MNSSSASYLSALNDKQREAALTTEGPLIVLAGAGSGKTKMLTSRICYLIEHCHVPPYRVLAVTFTNKAAGEMRERVERMLNQAAKEGHGAFLGNPEIGTFHSVCVRLLRRELDRTPFTKSFVIYDDSDQLSLIKGALNKLNIDEKAFNPKAVQGAINRAKCDALEPAEMEPAPHDIFARQVKRIYEVYQKDLIANNALDFGEIICMTYRILRDNPDLRQKYQQRFQYIHVDEYQDTNRAQYLLLSMLAGKRNGGHQNICVVGDEDQSIYKWRGADIRNILDFESDYPGAHIVKLEQNYRSTKTIIKAASQVIRNNTTRKDKTLWTDNEDGLPIVRAQVPDERAEAELVVREIKLQAQNEGRAYGDFSVFYRTNAQSRQFEDVLRREKIPYQVVGGLRFYDRKEIKDILSYFKVILNPSDSVNLRRIINVPARGIGKTTLEKIDELHLKLQSEQQVQPQLALSGASGAAEISYWDALVHASREPSITSSGTARKLAQFVTLVERFRAEQPNLLLSELYHLILDETGYVRELRKEGTEEAMARVENLEEFDTILLEFEESNYDNLETPSETAPLDHSAKKGQLLAVFIEQSSLVSEADNIDSLASSVKLMTLHSSKGLEFPVVFLVGMEEGLFPSIKPWEESLEEDVEEERRLCYVGMTRARERLFLMNVVVRRLWGNVNYQDPSRFFSEMPDSLVQFKDLAQVQVSAQGMQRQYGRSWVDTGGRTTQTNVSARGPEVISRPSFTTTGQLPPTVVGRHLNHPEYGRGTVVLSEGFGDDQKVTVEFAGRQRRKFLFRYVNGYLG